MFKKLTLLHIFNIFSFIFILLPFLLENPITQRDMVGHLFAADFTKEFLLPSFRGWNPFHNLGYPIGSYYPFIPHYLMALLGAIGIDIEVGIKLIFILSYLSLPYSIYYFIDKVFLFHKFNGERGRDINKTYYLKLGVTLLTLSLIIIAPSTFGGGLKGAFIIGLITNFYALPIIFLYLGKALSVSRNSSRKHHLILALLLSFLMLSHLVGGAIALIFTLTLWIFELKKLKLLGKKIFKNPLSSFLLFLFKSRFFFVLFIAFLITSFFYIPYILNTQFLTAAKPLVSSVPVTLIITSIICFTTFGGLYAQRKRLVNVPIEYWGLLLLLLILGVIPIIDIVGNKIFDELSLELIHAYRILPYLYFIGIPVITSFFIIFWLERTEPVKQKHSNILSFLSRLNNSELIKFSSITILILLLLAVIFKDYGQTGFDEPDIDYSDFRQQVDSNFLALYNFDDLYDLNKLAYYESIRGNWKNFSVSGQFEESSYLNHYAYSLRRGVDPEYYEDSTKSDSQYIELIKPSNQRVSDAIRLFNIGYFVYTDKNDVGDYCKNEEVLIKDFSARTLDKEGLNYKKRDLFFCELKNGYKKDYELIDVEKVRSIAATDWDVSVKDWWVSEEDILLIQDYEEFSAEREITHGMKAAEEDSTAINWEDDFQSFNIDSNLNSNQLILVKVQYNPRWKAYIVDGDREKNELDILRVSPSLMAVYGKGKIHFEYRYSTFENSLLVLSLTVSLLAVGAIIFLHFRDKKQPKKSTL